jgi:hypothetical protein
MQTIGKFFFFWGGGKILTTEVTHIFIQPSLARSSAICGYKRLMMSSPRRHSRRMITISSRFRACRGFQYGPGFTIVAELLLHVSYFSQSNKIKLIGFNAYFK